MIAVLRRVYRLLRLARLPLQHGSRILHRTAARGGSRETQISREFGGQRDPDLYRLESELLRGCAENTLNFTPTACFETSET